MSTTFTAEQIQHYRAYERVRLGGRYNMFDPKARKATKLDKDEFFFVMRNFSALREASQATASTTDAGVVG